jgi:hypothetical protein
LTSASPSTTVAIRRGTPSRRRIAVAASASVGPRIAPSAKADAQGRPKTSWASTATPTIVASTSPIASNAITRMLRRRACWSAKKAAE